MKHPLDALDWLTPKLQCQLLAKKGLEKGGSHDWRSTLDDPFFYLQHKNRSLKGWYMLSVEISATVPRVNAKLYVDYGEGIVEEDAYQFNLITNKLLKQVCFFPGRPKRLRFDPCEEMCEFSIKQLVFSKLTAKRARELMLKKLQSHRNLAPCVEESTANLLAAYAHCFDRKSGLVTYPQWLSTYERRSLDPQGLEAISDSFRVRPRFSILLATYNTQLVFLKACIDSVRAQYYPHWQLCIADDASTDPQISKMLAEYTAKDDRICWVQRQQNGHISEASNTALALANGDYVGLLDHDDLLAPHALLMMAQAIAESPDAEFFYSDEDKIDEVGNRREPHFKPDWNRDLFYSHNFITHFAVIKKALVDKIGGFRKGVEGSQDYDLFLRAIAHLGNKQIVHLPHVLYHWRAINGSTALNAHEKDYTTKAGFKALKDYFRSTNLKIEISEHNLSNCYRVTWPLPEPNPLVSLIIPTRDGYQLLKSCIESILSVTQYKHFEILVMNNQSQCPQTLQYFGLLERQGVARVIDFDHEFNFSAINNLGVQHARGSIVGLINNDIEVLNPDWLEEMVRHACRPDIGCVGAKLYYPDMQIQHAGIILGIGGVAGHGHKHFGRHHHGYHSRLSLVQNFSAVTAAALLVRKSVYVEVGGLETHLKVAFNDVDFCLKVREAGYRNLWTPFAEMIHHESVSRGYEDSPEKQKRFEFEIDFMQRKWGDKLENDPCYNPNLTLNHEDFSCKI